MTVESLIANFRDALSAAGLNTSDQIIADGRLHPFHVEGDRRSKLTGYYVVHLDDFPNATYGCHKRYPGQSLKWSPERTNRLSYDEQRAIAIKAKAAANRSAQAQRAATDAASARSNLIWDAATPCEEHIYLTRKGIQSHGLRVAPWIKDRPHNSVTDEVRDVIIPDALLVPIRNSQKQIVSLQAIFPDANNPLRRDKDFMAGGEKRGCYFTIGNRGNIERKQVIIVAEGFATAASCYEATGIVTVVAFDAGNLKPVAQAVRSLMRNCTLVVAADNDRWTTEPINNPGVTCAREASAAVGGVVAIPEFQDRNLRVTDFNDLHVLEGLAEVRRQIMASLTTPTASMLNRGPANIH